MAYKLIEFKCTRCDKIQEQLVSNSEEKPEDSCVECDALPDNLERCISVPTARGGHISWSKWRAGQ